MFKKIATAVANNYRYEDNVNIKKITDNEAIFIHDGMEIILKRKEDLEKILKEKFGFDLIVYISNQYAHYMTEVECFIPSEDVLISIAMEKIKAGQVQIRYYDIDFKDSGFEHTDKWENYEEIANFLYEHVQEMKEFRLFFVTESIQLNQKGN